METVLVIVIGLFFAASIFLILSRHLVRVLLGVSIFGNAVNLSIFTSGRLTEAVPPVLAPDGSGVPAPPPVVTPAPVAEAGGAMPLGDASAAELIEVGSVASGIAAANPLPQALILTAIVIAFSFFAFLLVLTLRAYQVLGTDDMDEMREAEPVAPQSPPLGY